MVNIPRQHAPNHVSRLASIRLSNILRYSHGSAQSTPTSGIRIQHLHKSTQHTKHEHLSTGYEPGVNLLCHTPPVRSKSFQSSTSSANPASSSNYPIIQIIQVFEFFRQRFNGTFKLDAYVTGTLPIHPDRRKASVS